MTSYAISSLEEVLRPYMEHMEFSYEDMRGAGEFEEEEWPVDRPKYREIRYEWVGRTRSPKGAWEWFKFIVFGSMYVENETKESRWTCPSCGESHPYYCGYGK